jgi:hypothetical protein
MFLTVLLSASVALAQGRGARPDDAQFPTEDATPPPKYRLWYTNATFVRVNPLGLVNPTKIGLRTRLSDKTSLLLNDTYAFAGMSTTLTPAWARVGGYAEVQPLSLIRVFADVSAMAAYGTFDQILTWDDPSARFSDQTIADRGSEASPEVGWTATLGATARAKAGPIAVRNTVQMTRIDLALDQDGLFFYDQYWDRLAKDGGWMWLNDLDLLALAGPVRAGVRYTASRVLDDRPATADSAGTDHRVGPLFAYQFKGVPHSQKINQTTLFVLAQWWADHPYRTGVEQPGALPLIAVGFAFNGDLKTWESF